ncbi:MAG: hydrolase [Gammaproteobacteria bacterium]|nr:hydrolase [Gammaproteobacteria bacterium]
MSVFFKAPWWLTNGHAQTLWASKIRARPVLSTHRERWELNDGDFLDLDFTDVANATADTPVVLVLHGLAGSIDSKYASSILQTLQQHGYRGVLMHFRSCSGEANRLPRSYHSGETTDPRYVIQQLQHRFPQAPLAAIGYSLGGNVLLKLLGEQAVSGLQTAIAISVPFELASCANRLNRGFSKFYRDYLLRGMKKSLRLKLKTVALPIDHKAALRCRDFWEFDNLVTAPLHGFRDVHDYYAQSSSRAYIPNIQTPTLILHALDDPFMTHDCIPTAAELPACVQLELSDHGGHVGFRQHQGYWLETRILHHLQNTLPLSIA